MTTNEIIISIVLVVTAVALYFCALFFAKSYQEYQRNKKAKELEKKRLQEIEIAEQITRTKTQTPQEFLEENDIVIIEDVETDFEPKSYGSHKNLLNDPYQYQHKNYTPTVFEKKKSIFDNKKILMAIIAISVVAVAFIVFKQIKKSKR